MGRMCVVYMGSVRNVYEILVGKLVGQSTPGYFIIDGWIMLNRTFNNIYFEAVGWVKLT
jgi:hypothetical protein